MELFKSTPPLSFLYMKLIFLVYKDSEMIFVTHLSVSSHAFCKAFISIGGFEGDVFSQSFKMFPAAPYLVQLIASKGSDFYIAFVSTTKYSLFCPSSSISTAQSGLYAPSGVDILNQSGSFANTRTFSLRSNPSANPRST